MLSKRVLAICNEKAVLKPLQAGLQAAGGALETVASTKELVAGPITHALVVFHAAGDNSAQLLQLAGRIKGGCLVVIVSSSTLADIIGSMKVANVAAVVVADPLDPVTVSSIATRILHGDIFGLERMLPWGVRIYSRLVGDYQEKSLAISEVNDFAITMGVRRKYRESIEQCLDEMLMNALYDAPVDASGKARFADLPTKTRISLRVEQKVVLQYACDGKQFALSVRDSFGTLEQSTVIKYLERCVESATPLQREGGGAGLGLFIIANSATQFVLNIYPGVATEAVCTFDLNAPKIQLKEFGIYKERIDSTGLLGAGPSQLTNLVGGRASPLQSKWMTGLLAAAVALLVGLVLIVAYPRFAGLSAGSIAVTTVPLGASIELDGESVGKTGKEPMKIVDLQIGNKYKVTAHLDGYDTIEQIVSPKRGATQSVSLTLRPQTSLVTLDTDPPGALVSVDGKPLGKTPIVVARFEPGSEQTITFSKPGYGSIKRKVRVPAPGQQTQILIPLVVARNLASVNITSDPPGAQILQNGELLVGLLTPIKEHLIEANKPYVFTIKRTGFMPSEVPIQIGPGQRAVPVNAKLRPGGTLSVHVNVPRARISVAGVAACQNRPTPMKDCFVPNGEYKIKVTSRRPYVVERLTVKVNNNEVDEQLDLGFVETDSPSLSFKIRGAPKNLHKAAFAPGPRKLTLVNENGDSFEANIRIIADQTVSVGVD